MSNKKYIFITWSISDIQGGELYIYGKSKWLKEQGWKVHVFSSRLKNPPYAIAELNEYSDENIPILHYSPFDCSDSMVKTTIHRMLTLVNDNDGLDYDETIIESHDGSTALWGELLAHELSAKHVIALFGEGEEYRRSVCRKNRDFFLYKLHRKELFSGIHALRILFEDDAKMQEKDATPFRLQESPVQDVNNDQLNLIKDSDYIICYIGRPNKKYFPSIFEGVMSFAERHSDYSVEFVVIGDTSERKFLLKKSRRLKNLSIVELGVLFPIPKKLFRKVDVVIAGAGSAMCSIAEGIFTIIPDVDNYRCNGVLGFDTIKTVGREEGHVQTTYENALERVLIRKDYKIQDSIFPKQLTIDECCMQNMQLITFSDAEKIYYEINYRNKDNGDLYEKLKGRLVYYLPFVASTLIKVKTDTHKYLGIIK